MPRTALKYRPLLAHLEAQPPDVRTVTLPLDAIAALLGGPLPASAWTTGFWSGSLAVRDLRWSGGWTARLSRATRTVTFSRAPSTGPTRRPVSDPAALIVAYQAGAAVREVAVRCGVTRMTVYRVLRQAGIPLRGRRP